MLLRESVIQNWVIAICKLAIEEHQEREYLDQANLIVEVLKNQDDFTRLLNVRSEVLDEKIDKDQILDKVFQSANLEPYLMNVMKILAREYSFEYVRPIFKGVRKLLFRRFNEEYGVIWSTTKLQESDIQTIETKLSQKLNAQVKLVNKLDPNLIGGVQVVIANQIFDLSIKGQLDQLKLQTLENKIK